MVGLPFLLTFKNRIMESGVTAIFILFVVIVAGIFGYKYYQRKNK